MKSQLVRQGYNAVAGKYLSEREQLRSTKYVQKLLKLIPTGSKVLDLGCGAGVPVDDLLLKAGHEVRGIDSSEEMIRRARQKCPGGEYLVREIADLKKDEYKVEAVVSFYALFHLPRSAHGQILQTINSYLPKGGYLLITMGDKEFEGTADFYGVPMWYSQWAPAKNAELVRRAGLEIILDEIDKSGSEQHQVILAKKN